MSYVIQLRRDTAANFTSVNTTLHAGEIGYETDTGKMKVGDGATSWTGLSYFNSSALAVLLAGYSSTTGTISSSDTILSAIEKLNGNSALKIGGSTGSTDRAVLIANGTGGLTEQASSVTIDANNGISGFATVGNDQTGTTYSLQASDMGKTVTLNNASTITVTLPNNLQSHFTCEFIQLGVGQVGFTTASGATLNSYTGLTHIAGQHAAARVTVTANSGGSSAVYNLAGNLA